MVLLACIQNDEHATAIHERQLSFSWMSLFPFEGTFDVLVRSTEPINLG